MPLLWPPGTIGAYPTPPSKAGPSRPPHAVAHRTHAQQTSAPQTAPPLVGFVPFAEARRRAEDAFIKGYVEDLLGATKGNIARAAYFAKLDRSNFKRLMKRVGVVAVRPTWNGLCPANQHGLDFEGQACALCVPVPLSAEAQRKLDEGIADAKAGRVTSADARTDDGIKDWHEMQPLVRAIYERHSAGCCWHIVLDDGNVDDEDVEYCIGHAGLSENCPSPIECRALGPLMRRASRTQRKKIAEAVRR